MFNEIMKELNMLRSKLMTMIFTINSVIIAFALFIVYYIMSDIAPLYMIISLVLTVVLTTYLIMLSLSLSTKIGEVRRETLYPYIVREVSLNWSYRKKGFEKSDLNSTLLINRSGSLKSTYQIYGLVDEFNYAISYLRNIISNGKSTQEVFNGTIIGVDLTRFFPGVLHIRMKGRPAKLKKEGLVASEVKQLTVNGQRAKVFSTDQLMVDQVLESELIRFYESLVQEYGNRVYLVIAQNRLMVALHTRKDYLKFSNLERITEEKITQVVKELKEIEKIVNSMSKYIQNHLK